jgi:predicted CoA-binding protein
MENWLVENSPMHTPDDPIARFLSSPAYGVVGASPRRHKYGNKVLRCYQQNGRSAIPVNPREPVIEGATCVASVLDLPDDVQSLSVITPPAVTEQVVEQAVKKGIRNVWMQPGAESAKAVATCQAHGLNVIADGSCLLVVLGFRGH